MLYEKDACKGCKVFLSVSTAHMRCECSHLFFYGSHCALLPREALAESHSLTQTTLAEKLLESLCQLTVLYVLAMQAIGLADLAVGIPLFNTIGGLSTTVVVIAIWWVFCRPRIPAGILAGIPLRLPLWLLCCTYFFFLADVLISYPNGYDAVAYHLLMPISWLRPVAVPLTTTVWQMALPANAELFALPAIALNAQNLVLWGNLAAGGILALSVYVLGRRLSASREGGALSAIIVLSVPIIVFQTFSLYVDAFGTAFLFAAVALLFRFQDTGRIQSLVLSVLCAGVSIGTKQTFLPYALLVLLFALALVTRRKQFVLIPLLILASAAPSALWIGRNWVSTGNPVYPFPLRAGALVLRGANDFPTNLIRQEPSLSFVVTRNVDEYPFSEFFGLGPAFATFAVAGILAMFFETFRRRQLEMFALLAVFLCVGSFWWILVHIVRFALPLIVMISIFCAILCVRFSGRQLLIARAFLTLGVAFSCLGCLSLRINRLAHRIQTGDWSRAAYYGYPSLIDRLPPGTLVLDRCEGRRSGFVLAGRSLQNRVFKPAGLLDAAAMSHLEFEYAVKAGDRDAEDRILGEYCDLVYDGTPVDIIPQDTRNWRIYKSRVTSLR
jgi:hypothetical protein